MATIVVKDGNGALQTINIQPALGQATQVNSLPVTIASDQTAVPISGTVAISGTAPVSGTVTANAGTNLNTSALALEATQSAANTLIGSVVETAPATDTASSGLNGRLQRIAQRLTSLIALLPTALGTSGGLKVDGSGTALPISGSVTVSGTTTISGSVTANAGTNLNTSALTLDATLTTTNTELGGLTETAPATDTASSGLNGRLQRIAQRLTSLIALLPTALGSGGGLKVDGSGTALPISGTVTANAGTGTLAVSAADGSSVTLGALADAAATAGATGSISAKLRSISRDLISNIVLAAGTNLIGKVGIDQTTPGTTNRVQSGGTTATIGTNFTRPNDSNAYAANDSVTDSTSAPTVLTFSNMARASGGTGLITDAVFIDESNPGTVGSFDLMLYDTTFTPTNDNAAFNPSTTIQRTFVGQIPFNQQIVAGSTSQAYHARGLNIAFTTVGSANLFGQIVARNSYTPAATGRFDIRLKVLQD